jgi:outer membrane protein insertion porin family
MKSLLRRYCVILALLLFWAPTGFGQGVATRVQEIEIKHVGPPAASDELIRSNIRLKKGDSYTRTGVDDDVRNLYGTGYFYNIRVVEEQVTGGVKLLYVVQGKPLLTDIKFDGNKKLSNAKLMKKVTSKVGEPFDERKLFSDAQELIKLYQKSGYQKTEVKYVPNITEASGRATVTFEVKEAPKVKIMEIEFVNATAFTQKKLAKVLKTRKHWMFSWITSSDVLKEDQFEDDKEKLTSFYHNAGYIDFEIKEVKYDYTSANRLAIRLVVFEGKQYKVGAVTFKGNSLFTADEINEGFVVNGRRKKPTMGAGATFTPDGLRKDIEAVQDYYGAKGYIDTKVITVKNANTETGNMDLTYEIEERDKAYIEKIEIKGNTKTKDKVLRRELAVSPGEVFDMVRVKLSKERLENTKFFEKVEAKPEDTDVPNRKNLVVAVEENPKTGNLSLGAGFSSVDSLVGFVEVSQGNFDLFNPPYFTGAGQKFRLRASAGTRRQDYVMTIIEPWFLDRKLQFSTELYRHVANYQSSLYDTEQTGMRLGLTRALGSDFLIGSVNYTIENVGITSVDTTQASPELQAEAGTKLVTKIGTSLAYDTRGGGDLPNRGQKTEIFTEVAGPFGGEQNFFKVEVRSDWYFRGFGEGHVLELSAAAGSVEAYGDSKNYAVYGQGVSLFNRYFLGGPSSMRGYRYPQVGPRDSLGEPFGGNTKWQATMEYSIPIISFLRVAAFYDIGMAYEGSFSLTRNTDPTTGLRQPLYNDNFGFGLRLNIPNLGPLRLDYGIPITHDDRNGGTGRFQFSVGYTRNY